MSTAGFVVLASGDTVESEMDEFNLAMLELAGIGDLVIEPRRIRPIPGIQEPYDPPDEPV